MKEELRPCIVKIGEEKEIIQYVGQSPVEKIIKEGQRHKAYFHKWIDESMSSGCESISAAYGIVEFLDGSVHRADPECITFTDRQNVSVNIDTDEIDKMVANMLKE